MNFKTILMALAMGSLVVGGVGCGGTPCDDVTDSADAAAAKAEECGVDLPERLRRRRPLRRLGRHRPRRGHRARRVRRGLRLIRVGRAIA
jgi:hypothetical protein